MNNNLTEEETGFINSLFLTENNFKQHVFLLGTTCTGRAKTSPQLQNIKPNQRNIKLEKEEKMKRDREIKRSTAIKRVYLAETSDDDFRSEFDVIYSCLFELGLAQEVNREIVTRVFMSLPDRIIGNGIQWGFTDSVVRDDIFEFIMNEDIAELLKIK